MDKDFKIILFGGAAHLVLALLALIALVGLLRYLDKSTGRHFGEHIDRMSADPRGLSIYLAARWLGATLLLGMLMGCAPRAAAIQFPTTYDRDIQKAVKLYWPEYADWQDWKAQLYQESRLDPLAVSGVGAQGLAQFMPGTWADVSRALGYGIIPRTLAQPAIDGGAFYMARLRRSWSAAGRPMLGRQQLAQASYNAGIGNILKAQAHCADAVSWADIQCCLPEVTGPQNAKQTIGYVSAIARWRGEMQWANPH